MAATAALLVGACGGGDTPSGQKAENTAAAQPAPVPIPPLQPGETLIGTESITAAFHGWDIGDYSWALLKARDGREISALIAGSPMAEFLTAHPDRPLMLTIRKIRMPIPESGGSMDIDRIVGASIDGASAEEWWAAMAPAARKSAGDAAEKAMVPIG